MNNFSPEPVGGNWNFDPEYHRFAGLLGLDPVKRQSDRMAERIYFIVNTLGGKSLSDKLTRLEKARKDLGTNQMGELLVNQLWQRMRLTRDVALEKDQEKIVLKDKAKEAAEKKAAQIEKEAEQRIMELQKAKDLETARIKELTDLTARVQAVQGGQYAQT